MYRIEWNKELPALATLVMLTAGVVYIFPRLPAQIPTHWNVYGQADHWASKSWGAVLWMPGLAWGTYLLLLYIPYLDSRLRGEESHFIRPYRRLRNFLLAFFTMISVTAVLAAFHPAIPTAKIVTGLMGLLIIGIGLTLEYLPPNHIAGIRLPWTLKSNEVWVKTHRLGKKAFVLGGLVGMLSVLFSATWMLMLFFSSLFVCLASTVVYARWLYTHLPSK